MITIKKEITKKYISTDEVVITTITKVGCIPIYKTVKTVKRNFEEVRTTLGWAIAPL